MIVSFRFYMMDCVDFMLNCYTHITSHVTQVFANCTHYTSYSLLNIAHVIVCLSVWPTKFEITLSIFFETYFLFENFKGGCLKILSLGKLSLKLVFWNSISSHSHAFYFLFSMLCGVFSKIWLFSLKFCFSRFSIDLICFRSIEISFKIFCELLSISINQNWFSINRKL